MWWWNLKFHFSIGKNNAPSYEKFSEIWYTKSQEYEELKKLAKYRENFLDADLRDYRLNTFLKSHNLIKGNVVHNVRRRAYILEDLSYKRDPAHIMKRMKERHITDDQVQDYVNNALICEQQFAGKRLGPNMILVKK